MIPWAHPEPTTQTASDQFSRFAQMTTECPYTLQWDAPFPLKIAASHGGIWTPSNARFSGPTRVLNPNGISIGSAVFARLTGMTDRTTDHAIRLVTIGRIYAHSTAIRPNNNYNNWYYCCFTKK